MVSAQIALNNARQTLNTKNDRIFVLETDNHGLTDLYMKQYRLTRRAESEYSALRNRFIAMTGENDELRMFLDVKEANMKQIGQMLFWFINNGEHNRYLPDISNNSCGLCSANFVKNQAGYVLSCNCKTKQTIFHHSKCISKYFATANCILKCPYCNGTIGIKIFTSREIAIEALQNHKTEACYEPQEKRIKL